MYAESYFYLMVHWIYSMSFSLAVMMGIIYIGIKLIKIENKSGGIVISLFGGMLTAFGFMIRPTNVFPLIAAGIFHLIWETNIRYSIPFILPMIIVAEYGISSCIEYTEKKKPESGVSRMSKIALIGIIVLACAVLNLALKEKKELLFYRILTSSSQRINMPVEPKNFEYLHQDFYEKNPFNTIFIKASLPEQKTVNECSEYELSILSDDGSVIHQMLLLPKDVKGQGITVNFTTISGYDHYFIRLRKADPEKDSIIFYTKYTYGLDEYSGSLKTDRESNYINDLIMDVYEVQRTSVFGDKPRKIVVIGLMAVVLMAVFVPDKKKFATEAHES